MTFDSVVKDMESALSVLHQHNLIHADVHMGNIMSSQKPDEPKPTWVLIDLGDNAAESIYPVREGYGAYVAGGDLRRPPGVTKSGYHTGTGDYHRLTLALDKEIWPVLKRHSEVPADIRASSEIQFKLQKWLTQALAESPPAHPITVWPAGSWVQSATNIMLILQTTVGQRW